MHVPLSLLDVLTIVSDSLITGHIYSIIKCVHKLADAHCIATYITKHNVDTHTQLQLVHYKQTLQLLLILLTSSFSFTASIRV